MAKHYQNDYKKLLGVDQSRTASQKLLDKVSSQKKTINNAQFQKQEEKNINGRKLVKREDKNSSISELEMFQKLKKIIETKQAAKIMKAFNILLKCLQSGQYSNLESGNQHLSILAIAEYAIDLCIMDIKGSLQQKTQMGNKIVTVFQKINSIIQNLTKCSQQNQKEHPVILNPDLLEEIRYLKKKINYKISFFSLLTDDNFCFQKALNSFRNSFTLILNQIRQAQQQTFKQQSIEYFVANNVLLQIFQLPQLQLLEWVQKTVTNFFKELIKQHRDKLAIIGIEENLLLKYNRMLSNNKKSISNSYGISNNLATNLSQSKNISGGAYTVVQKIDSAARWYDKQ